MYKVSPLGDEDLSLTLFTVYRKGIKMSAFIGIDVSKATLDIAIRQDNHSEHFVVKNTPAGFKKLHRKLSKLEVEQLGLEASGRYGEPLALWLVEQGYPVSYLNPKLTHRFAQTQIRYTKTDAQDAQLIAQYVQLHRPKLWLAPSPAQRLLTQRSRRLDALKKTRHQELNRLKSGITDEFVLQQIHDHIQQLDAHIDQTKQAIKTLIRQDPILKRNDKLLRSIKGIGEVTASLFLAEIGDISRFDSVKQLTAFMGLDSQDWQSGTSVKRPAHISKHGNSRLRAALYMPALTAMKHNIACRLLNQRLELRHKPGKVRVVAVMRKLLHQIFGVLKHQQLFDNNYHIRQRIA